jgi:dienelactone hydrolase
LAWQRSDSRWTEGEDFMSRLLLTIALAVLLHVLPARAQDFKQLVPRTELLPISSLTISDEQFLKGDPNGTPVTIAGELRIAQPRGATPVVILMHGSGGIGANVGMWVADFNAMGISTLAIDGFTGRGITATSTNQAQLGRLNFILDIYRALEILAKHPRIDATRIALMGFSRGGQAVLYASLKRFHGMWNKSGVDFATYLPFYPDCMTTYEDDANVSSSPIRIFGGTIDDYNPIAKCKAYADRLKSAGRDVVITEYPNAPHAFDIPLLPTPPIVAKGAQTVRNCAIREQPIGTLINAAGGQPFTYSDPCVERDPHVGFDPEATSQVRPAVAAIVKAAFKMQ